MWSFAFAFAQEVTSGAAENGAEATGGSPFGMLPLFVGMFAILYFLMIRPNQKREKERKEMLSSLSKGDRVVTNGGLCGTVVGLTEQSAVLRVSEDPPIKMEFIRSAISRVAAPDEEKGKKGK